MAGTPKDRPSIYQIKVTLKDIRPPIWRRLQVAGDLTLASLHDVIQIALGWTNSHLHQFIIGKSRYGVPHPDDMPWEPRLADESKVTLREALGPGGKRFVYEYDFGDGWQHDIVVEKTLPPAAGVVYPRCIAGRRACPPEDCGGPWGYGDFLEAIGDPEHPEHAERRDWVGGEFDPEEFDLEAVNAQFQPRRRTRR